MQRTVGGLTHRSGGTWSAACSSGANWMRRSFTFTCLLIATVTGALIFSAFHYVGPFGDQLELRSFVFRAIAGVAFSALYIVRGFGITSWTHALYDVMLLIAGS